MSGTDALQTLDDERAALVARNNALLSNIGLNSLVQGVTRFRKTKESRRKKARRAKAEQQEPFRRSARIKEMPKTVADHELEPEEDDIIENKPDNIDHDFTEDEKSYAADAGLDLESDECRVVRVLAHYWPESTRFDVDSRQRFERVYKIASVLSNKGFTARMLTERSAQAADNLTEDVIADLRKTELSALEVQMVIKGIKAMAGGRPAGAGGCITPADATLVGAPTPAGSKRERERTRAEHLLVNKLAQVFAPEIDSAANFSTVKTAKDKLHRYNGIIKDMGGLKRTAAMLKLSDSATEAEVHAEMEDVLRNKWRNTRTKKRKQGAQQVSDGGSGAGSDETAASPAVRLGEWGQLLGSTNDDLGVYASSSSHVAYLLDKDADKPEQGCFLVGAKDRDKGKPLPLGAGIITTSLDGLSTSDMVEVMVAATVEVKDWPKTLYLPSMTSAGPAAHSLQRPDVFARVNWPVRGILAVCDGKTAQAWAEQHWGRTEKSWKGVMKLAEKSKD